MVKSVPLAAFHPSAESREGLELCLPLASATSVSLHWPHSQPLSKARGPWGASLTPGTLQVTQPHCSL